MFFKKIPEEILRRICRKSSKKVLVLNRAFWIAKMAEIVQNEKTVFVGNNTDFTKIIHFSQTIREIEYVNVPNGFLILVPNAQKYIFRSCSDTVDLKKLNPTASVILFRTPHTGSHPNISIIN